MRFRGLGVYLLSATLARAADAGAVVAVVLLTSQLGLGGTATGLLAACLTAPHLLGPLSARLLDVTSRPRLVLGLACAVYAAAVAGSGTLLQHRLTWAAAGTLVVAGLCGPLLTGGLSSQLGALVDPHERAQRRAQGLDALTYGAAATGGPALVAVWSGWLGAEAAVWFTAALALSAAAALTLLRLTARRATTHEPALTVLQSMRVMLSTGPLRRVTVVTALTALPGGALTLIALGLAHDLDVTSARAATLLAAFGFGHLTGSGLVTLRPLRGSPDTLVLRLGLVLAAGFTACSVAPTYGWALLAFGLSGVATAIFFTASLSGRAAYAPENGRAQVFVTMAGLKVALSSIGVALAGLAVGVGARWLAGAGAVICLVAVLIALVDRGLERRRSSGNAEKRPPIQGLTTHSRVESARSDAQR